MEDNKKYKTFIVVAFPFLRAFFIGNTLFKMFSVWSNSKLFDLWDFFYDGNMVLLFAVVNALLAWGFFYLAIMMVFKRDEWLDRLYEFSKSLKVTVPFGACLLVYSFFEQAGYVRMLLGYGLFYGFTLFFIFLPLVLFEIKQLGVLIRKNTAYGHFKSQCLSFGLFLLLPFMATHLGKYMVYFIVQ
ncbi:MAG: hypothetical protein V3W31_01695 [Thermodesulfobacteriota bacterium]